MPVFNYPKKEVNVKVVYYGPGLSGKTTNLQKIHDRIKPDRRGKLVSLATQTDRTLFFDFMPLELGAIGGYTIRLHLYTVPGQVHYNATRKLVLKGVDGVVFVADSQRAMADTNVESIHNLEKNLQSYGKSLVDLPHIIQANKRDLDEAIPMEEIDSQLNQHGAKVIQAVASQGTGVMETLTEIIRMVIMSLRDQFVTETDVVRETPRAEGSAVAQGASNSAGSAESQVEDEPPEQPEPEPESSPVKDSVAQEVKGHQSEDRAVTEAEAEPEPELEPAAESASAGISPSLSTSASTVAHGALADKTADRESGVDREIMVDMEAGSAREDEVDRGEDTPEPASPVTITLPVQGLGTVELTLEVRCRVVGGQEDKAVDVHVTAAALRDAAPMPLQEPEHVPESARPELGRRGEGPEPVPEPEIAHEPAAEPEPLEVPEEPMEPLPLDKDLPPLDEASDEPLGAPLDGQEPDDLDIPDLPQEEKVLLAEDVNEAPEEALSTESSTAGYDPTVPSVEFDFPETEPEEIEPKKKGFFGRFKKK